MKNILAVLGVLAIVAIIVIAIGGFHIYKKSSSMAVTTMQQQVEDFISKKHPPIEAENSLRRILNAVKLHPSFLSSMFTVGIAMGTIEDNVVTNDELRMLDDASQILEQGEFSKEKMAEFSKKYENVMPRRYARPS